MKTIKRLMGHGSIPVVLAAVLRLLGLGRESFWYDESFTAWIAKLPIGKLLSATIGDVHPPTWYFIEWISGRLFGFSEFGLRLPSAIAGVVSVVLIWRLARALKLDAKICYVAALLAAVLPGALYYGQEARQYSLLACAVLWLTITAIRHKWRWFTAAAIAVLYLHNLGIFYVAAIGGVTFIHAVTAARWSTAKAIAVAVAASGVIWSPWAVVMIGQARRLAGGFWITPITPGGVLAPFVTMTIGARASDRLVLVGAVIVFAASLVALYNARHMLRSGPGVTFLAMVLVAPALMALVSALWRPVFLARALLASGMGLVVVWAYAGFHLSIPNRRAYRAVTVPALVIFLLSYYLPAYPRQDIRAFLDPVRSDWQAGDVVYYSSLPPAILAGYYLDGRDYRLEPGAGDLNQQLPEDSKIAFGFHQAAFDGLASEGFRRAWMVVSITYGSRPDEVERVAARVADGQLMAQYKQSLDNINYVQLWLLNLK